MLTKYILIQRYLYFWDDLRKGYRMHISSRGRSNSWLNRALEMVISQEDHTCVPGNSFERSFRYQNFL